MRDGLCRYDLLPSATGLSGRRSSWAHLGGQNNLGEKMTDEQIDHLIRELDMIAQHYDSYEYGLPNHDEETVKKMRAMVRSAVSGSKATMTDILEAENASQHSPGPWEIVSPNEVLRGDYIYAGDREVAAVSRCYQGERIVAMEKANARLIAAAPDLLEALERARPALLAAVYLTENQDQKALKQAILDAVNDAITKSTGQ